MKYGMDQGNTNQQDTFCMARNTFFVIQNFEKAQKAGHFRFKAQNKKAGSERV